MSKIKSKGKWLPGTQILGKPCVYSFSFYCKACERGFSKNTAYERHLSTELHFKRTSKEESGSSTPAGIIRSGRCTSYDQDPDFFEKVHVRSHRSCRARKDTSSQLESSEIHCPTCFANVAKSQMGKHLISHFHCQVLSFVF